ncbi:MAG: asparagine synthetase A [Candidatus Bathyarchaeia archaeon]
MEKALYEVTLTSLKNFSFMLKLKILHFMTNDQWIFGKKFNFFHKKFIKWISLLKGRLEGGVTQQKSLPMMKEVMDVAKPLEQLSERELLRKKCIGRVMTHTLRYLTGEFVKNGFEWLLPVIFSKATDPLWPDPGASLEKRIEVEIYGETVRTTLSMIVHKMVACSLAYPKLFTLSPNIRLERRERAHTGIHAYEFTQLDFEIREATSSEIRTFVEKIFCGLIKSLRRNLREELNQLERYDCLKVPRTPFKVYEREELERIYGMDWETKAVQNAQEPFWVVNIPREFYDFEDFENGRWDNYDLFLPKYGEVLSGSRREWDYEKIIRKMERDGLKKENFKLLLSLAREGRIKPSAGAGIGVERLVSWIVGARHIGETQTFPKIPGIIYDL